MVEHPDTEPCVFCQRLLAGKLLFENDLVVAFRDAYPLNPGHVHIAPRRHEPNFMNMSPVEKIAMMEMLDEVQKWLQDKHDPSGYTLGANIGLSAGQSVPHANLHVIPRFEGDTENPRGGVRWVLPDKADYSG